MEALAKLRSGWSKSEREAWVKKNRRRLKEGQIDEVIDSIDSVCRGTRNTLLKRERNYFTKNRQRMQYGQVAAQRLPIGSGAIESAIRRVVNLRLKGACIYWTEESASEMLLLRSYYKAGRWETLKDMANQVA